MSEDPKKALLIRGGSVRGIFGSMRRTKKPHTQPKCETVIPEDKQHVPKFICPLAAGQTRPDINCKPLYQHLADHQLKSQAEWMYVGKIVQWLERIFKPGSSPLDVLFVVATAPRKNGVIDPTTWKASMEALHLQAADHPCVYDGHGRRLMNKTGQHLLYAAKEHMSQALMHLDPSNNAAVHGKRMTDMFRYAANVTMRGLAKNVPTYKLPKDEVIGGHGHFSEDDHHICRFLESTNLLSLLEHPLRDKACDLAHHLIDHYNMDQPSRYFVDSAADSKIIDLLWSLAHAKALYHSVAHLHLELHGDSQHLNSEDYNYRLTQEKNLQDVERLFEEWRGGQPHAELPAGITAAELDTRAT